MIALSLRFFKSQTYNPTIMIKETVLLFAILFGLTLNTQAQFDKLLKKAEKVEEAITGSGLTEAEIGNGLKEALNEGVKKAVNELNVKDGYLLSPYKILVPEEAQNVVKKLSSIPGFENVERDLIEKMNRAAELAAEKAKPIFVSAIKQMTFRDAMDILMGNQDAATRYLEGTTSGDIYKEFLPVIRQSLDEVNAREYWRNAVNTYNKIPFVTKTNPELDDHVTDKALVGLFSLVEKKEVDIRENTSSRTSDLLRKVFAKQD